MAKICYNLAIVFFVSQGVCEEELPMITKSYLIIVGILYLYLAVWCSFDPAFTSKAVGFELIGASGQSEFLTVYGGLEFGIAMVFLMPLVDRQAIRFSLTACTLIHASLVGFRTLSLVMFAAPERMTYQLALGEWIIFLTSMALWFATRRPAASTASTAS